MTREVRFLPSARLEAIDARDWYAKHSQRAAEAFVTEMDRQLLRIAENAESFPLILSDVHRVRLRRFPYSLLSREPRPEDLAGTDLGDAHANDDGLRLAHAASVFSRAR